MSSTDNIIHLVLATCYNILNDAASKIDARLDMHSQSYQVPLCRTQQRKASFFTRTIVDWNRLPQTAVLSDSVESFRTAITTSYP